MRHSVLTVFICANALLAAEPRDYSKEAAVIQDWATKVSFAEDGSRTWEQTLTVKLQSEAAVRQFGVLSFSYSAENEQMKIDYLRVRKADGSVVETPESSVQDVATEVARVAPTYSDLRQKQIPVKALGVGDVLEYSVHTTLKNIEMPGQFWYGQYFAKDAVVLSQTLEISVPKEKYVQVASPKVKYETRDEGERRIYLWKYSQLELSKPEPQKKAAGADEEKPLQAQITSFKSWEEVGAWWAALAAPQADVTPAIQQKADELTSGLVSEADKARAIYKYVGMKFRYISISLGAGRYKPHSAAEVLANQYGDCKDKHTLFAALLKAAGIQAWPALIGAGMKFEESVPTPAQFNHVITVLPQGANYTWLDTTAEVAPYGLLNQIIRDEQALVIPTTGKALLRKTPLNPPFLTADSATIKASLDSDGTLTGHLDVQSNGDSGLVLRSAFRQLAPTQWQAMTQQISYALGYAGDVSGVDVEDLENAEKPFHYSYDYTRKTYSDWEEHKITPPLPPLYIGPGDEADKPKEAFWVGAPGTVKYSSETKLPKDFSVDPPPNAKVNSEFADYSSSYVVKDGTLFAERQMTVKQAKISPAQWEAYQTFIKAVKNDQITYTVLTDNEGDVAAGGASNKDAANLVQQASVALQGSHSRQALDLLNQAEQLNVKEPHLWSLRGYIAMVSGDREQGLADCRKEIRFHPADMDAYQQLSQMLIGLGRSSDSAMVWMDALAANPEDAIAASSVAGDLMRAKKYSEVPAILEKPIAAAPENTRLRKMRIDALLRGGQKQQGLAEAQTLVKSHPEPLVLNDLSYELSETGGPMDVAEDWARHAIEQTEEATSHATLTGDEKKDFSAVYLLAAEWDTLGWIYFRENKLPEAEKYVDASWRMNPSADVGFHLGEIYEREGKRAAAIHMWRLVLTINRGKLDAQESLRKVGSPLPTIGGGGMATADELNRLRTFKIPDLPKQTGSAELFLLVSAKGVEDTHFISGVDGLRNSGKALRTADYGLVFPDNGPEKIIRSGILSCSQYTTPSCLLTLIAPGDAAK